MCLSGGEQEHQNKKLVQCFQQNYADIAEYIVIKTDTFGSVATACPNGLWVTSCCAMQNQTDCFLSFSYKRTNASSDF